MSHLAKFAAALVAVAIGIGIGILVERSSSDEPDTAASKYLIPTNESPAPETAEVIKQFAMLEKPTVENLSDLSEEDRHRIREGLLYSRDDSPEVTSVGRTETKLADVLVFTTDDEMCLYSSPRRELLGDQLTGNCFRLGRAPSGWVDGMRQYGFERRGYAVAVLPDRVTAVELSEPVGKVRLRGNVAESLTRVKDFVIRGLDGNRVVTRTNVPLRTFWHIARYP